MKRILAIRYILLMLFASGCAMQTVPLDTEEGSTGKLILGKVTVKSPVAPSEWLPTDQIYWEHPDSFSILILAKGADEPFKHQLIGDGSFQWRLPSGEYFVPQWEWVGRHGNRKTWSTWTGRVGASFVVPESESAMYLGNLEIGFAGRRYAVRAQEDGDTKQQIVRENVTKDTPVISSLWSIERLPDSDKVVSICGGYWLIKCDDEWNGVEVISPRPKELDFPLVETITPTLRWEPSSKKNILYDLIVYEALPYWDAAKLHHAQGKILVYELGLESPEYQFENPLKSKQKFFWSVRFREDDTVSDWSTISYKRFLFLVFAFGWTAGSGIPFSFSTP